jgi:hypothetical protein
MTLTEMAKVLGLKSTTALRILCENKALPAELKGKTWFVTPQAVEDYRRTRLGRRGRPAARKAKTTTTTTTATTAPRAPETADDVA